MYWNDRDRMDWGGGAGMGVNTCTCPNQCKDVTERGDEPLLISAKRKMGDLLKKKAYYQ